MEEIQKKDLLLRNVPMDVCDALEERAARNYRSVCGEILAILTAIARGGDTLPGLGIGEVLPMADIAISGDEQKGGVA